MTVGIAGPMTLKLLDFDWGSNEVPVGYEFPFTSYMINALLEKGVKVIAYTHSTGIDKPLVFQDERITICIGRKTNHAGRNLFLNERRDLVYLMKKHRPDIINAQWSYEFAWAALDSGIPTTITVRDHALTIFKYFKDFYRFSRLIMNKIVLGKANHIITNSEYLKQLLNTRVKKNAVVINNFYQPFLESYFTTEKNRSKWIISVCNGFDERKNVKNGIKGFQEFRVRYPEYTYKLVGVGMEKDGPAHKYAVENDLDQNIDFVGYIPFSEVIKMISVSDILLHPSREESFGNTLLEAMVVGTNVIGGEASGNVPFLQDHGKIGRLCDVNNPASIAEALISFVSDEDFFEEQRILGHQYGVSNFSKNAIINKLLNHYEEVLKIPQI